LFCHYHLSTLTIRGKACSITLEWRSNIWLHLKVINTTSMLVRDIHSQPSVTDESTARSLTIEWDPVRGLNQVGATLIHKYEIGMEVSDSDKPTSLVVST
jgi:hypothetical protein